jgi:hypothetical protein
MKQLGFYLNAADGLARGEACAARSFCGHEAAKFFCATAVRDSCCVWLRLGIHAANVKPGHSIPPCPFRVKDAPLALQKAEFIPHSGDE